MDLGSEMHIVLENKQQQQQRICPSTKCSCSLQSNLLQQRSLLGCCLMPTKTETNAPKSLSLDPPQTGVIAIAIHLAFESSSRDFKILIPAFVEGRTNRKPSHFILTLISVFNENLTFYSMAAFIGESVTKRLNGALASAWQIEITPAAYEQPRCTMAKLLKKTHSTLTICGDLCQISKSLLSVTSTAPHQREGHPLKHLHKQINLLGVSCS
jgi:hypothetical protein